MIMAKLEEKRNNQEKHIKELENQGKAGNRYTSNLSNKQWLFFSIIADIGWIVQFICSIQISAPPNLSLKSVILYIVPNLFLIFGVVYAIILNKRKEKIIAKMYQILLSIGMIVLSSFLIIMSLIITLVIESGEDPLPSTFFICLIGATLSLIFGIITLLSYKKGIRYTFKKQ